MNYIPDSRIAFTAFGLLAVSVIIHLFGGLGELYAISESHGMLGYAILMFVGAALPLVLLGAMVVGLIRPVPSYVLLAGLMILHIVTYADVHGFGYLEALTGAELHTHDHVHDSHSHNGHDHADDSAVITVIDHLEEDPIALVCKLCEGIAAVLFATLAALER